MSPTTDYNTSLASPNYVNNMMDDIYADLDYKPIPAGGAPLNTVPAPVGTGPGPNQGFDIRSQLEGLFGGGGTLGNFAKFGSGIASLAGAWNAYQQNKLMNKQFDLAEGLAKTNLRNQATVTNEGLKSQTSAKAQLMGKKHGSDAYSLAMANGPQVSGKI